MSKDLIVAIEVKKPEKERDTWTGKFDFFLSALGYAGRKF